MWRILCECLRSKGKIVYHIASSGIEICYFLKGGLQIQYFEFPLMLIMNIQCAGA